MTSAWDKFYRPDFPKEWIPPPDLLDGPAFSPLGNLAREMLKSRFVGNDLIEGLGLYLAADARFEVWYGEGDGYDNPTGLELAQVRIFGMDVLRRVYTAWKRLEDAGNRGDRPNTDAQYQELLGELRSAVSETCSRMGESLADFGNL
jgi:hypothetical protein